MLILVAVSLLASAGMAGDQVHGGIVLKDQKTGECLARFDVSEGSTVELSWVHSVEQAEWREFYEVRDGSFVLDCAEPGSFGAGTPYSAPRTDVVDGRVRFCGLDRRLPTVTWIHSHAVAHTVSVNGRVVVESRDLPHHAFISMRVL